MKVETGQYYTVERRKEVADSARKLRRQFLRYKEAEIVYSIPHKKLPELAGKAETKHVNYKIVEGLMSGNLWMFSDKLDDQDILFAQHSFITYNMGSEYYSLSVKVFTK